MCCCRPVHGVPVLAHRMAKFDPNEALRLMAEHGVRNVFLPPTALKMMRAVPDPRRLGARPRSIGSGGETLGAELLDWGRATFGVTINEFYGQTECNLVVCSCAAHHAGAARLDGPRGARAMMSRSSMRRHAAAAGRQRHDRRSAGRTR